MFTRRLAILSFACIVLLLQVSSHSWVERVVVLFWRGNVLFADIAAPGYMRGYVPRVPTFLDADNTYLLPPDGEQRSWVLPSDFICKETQRTANYTPRYYKLRNATAGGLIGLQYNENGHITMPQNNPPGKDGTGTIYIYGTSQPTPSDKLMDIHLVWNRDGTGGDRRGILLDTFPFDDGRCYQYATDSIIQKQRAVQNSLLSDPAQGLNRWCTNFVRLPDNLKAGDYTLYWVWDWSFETGEAQLYTSCIDIVVGNQL